MRRFFILFLSLFLSFSCVKENIIQIDFQDNLTTKTLFSTRDLATEDFIVEESQLFKYIEFKEVDCSDIENSVQYVDAYCRNESPIYYVIQYERGWEIISADMRGPIVLAQSDTGFYKECIENELIREWLSSIADEIDNRRKDAKHYDMIYSSLIDKESSSLAFWKLITGDERFLNQYVATTKVPVEPIEYTGYWMLTGQHQRVEVDEYVPHLMRTKWHQRAPFNYYCPYKTSETNKKSPAGCVAVAGAQMLYYLHYNLGAPIMAPTEATSFGNVNSYSITVGGGSQTVWDDMVTTDYDVSRHDDISYWDWCSALVAQVGVQVGMKYGNNESGAKTKDLVSKVFAMSGIDCKRTSFNADKLLSSLKDGMPVVASAKPWEDAGHAFIIDGYKSNVTKYYCDYQWMKYLGNGEYEPESRYLHEVTYSSPKLQEIYMNWGWGGSYDDIAFAPSGTWSPGGANLSLEKMMIYDFAVAK